MSEEYAPVDYEPTPEEAAETFGFFERETPGHGFMEMVPAMEKWLWSAEGVWWTGREVMDDGRIRIQWLIPERRPH